MGRLHPRDYGIHGDTPATSQALANQSCIFFNFIPGINLPEVFFPQPSPTTQVLTDTPNRINLPESNVGQGNTTGLS